MWLCGANGQSTFILSCNCICEYPISITVKGGVLYYVGPKYGGLL